IAINKIRRSERAQTSEWIEEFLKSTDVITIAMVDNGLPYAVVRNFVYDPDQKVIYLHGARSGRTCETLLDSPMVCCTAQRMGRLLPASKASQFSVEYSGVTIFGKAALVNDPEESYTALSKLVEKYFPQLEPEVDYMPAPKDVTQTTAVYRVNIISWSGKENIKDDDFPGAYNFESKIDQEQS
ncbi:MAG: hypothetical protein GWO41_06085, partial [candidate division Zixibacteria bacterium]|nr:hypothetical protein [candidate division Zixibacteria bacterium]NIW49245.1 hypothetical protein [Gammaproteobacteria bacterium]NIR67125.1 hypothetical protein [candidate division Zixibacteria bacterium]NIS48547.1 hypothetical protein [candidate division Zixibacteria bacterium]NIT52310.1 hypothetical protein [candidate division Zixibacteria bacterium]